MLAINRKDLPVALEADGVEVRATEVGELTAGWFSLAKGVDLGPALVGLPGDLCQCPHWGYMLKGRLRMRTADGDREYRAGDARYWAPGHAPEALEELGARPPDGCPPATDPQLRGDAPELHLHERSRYRAAAGHARRIYPGPLGELVYRELNAYAEFGRRFGDDGLIPRPAASVLAARSDPFPTPSRARRPPRWPLVDTLSAWDDFIA